MPCRNLWSTTKVSIGIRSVAYLVGSWLLLLPVISTPLVADDFLNPFSQTADGGSTLVDALRYGWKGGTQGANFRVVGSPVGAVFNWLLLTLSAHLDVSIPALYALAKFAVLLVCAGSLAAFWWVAAREFGSRLRFWDALVLVSLVLFAALQIHGQWSNDPVASYPLAGYLSAAIGFAVLTSAILAVRHQSRRMFVCAAGVALVAVLYYEINVGAVLGGFSLLIYSSWKRWRQSQQISRGLCGAALFVALPAIALLYGRTAGGANPSSYAGTQMRLSSAPRAFAYGVLGSLPGSAWTLSRRIVGGHIRIVGMVFGLTFVLVVLVRWWFVTWHALETIDGLEASSNLGDKIFVFVAVATYGLFAVAIQAVTIKVQDEMVGLGYVYTFYAVSSCAVALGLAVLCRFVLSRIRVLALQRTVAWGFMIFVVIQLTISWDVSESMNQAFKANRRLIQTFDSSTPTEERCGALAEWSTIPWPDYYKTGMTDGLQKAYIYYFGEAFCPAATAG